MTIGAEADAEVHLGPLVLNALVDIHGSLNALNRHLRNIARIEEAYQFGVTEQPIRKVGTSAATGNLNIGLGGPAYGRLWEVKRLTVGGVLWTSTVAGTAIVCVGPDTHSVTPPLTDIADEAASLPSVAYYSARQLVVRHPNHLYVVILTPTASTQYAVGGQVSDFADRRYVSETGN